MGSSHGSPSGQKANANAGPPCRLRSMASEQPSLKGNAVVSGSHDVITLGDDHASGVDEVVEI